VVTAACLIAVFLLSLFLLPMMAWQLVCAGVAGVCAVEWGRLCGLARHRTYAFAAIVAVIFVLFASSSEVVRWICIASAIIWILAFAQLLTKSPRVPRSEVRLLAGAVIIVAAALALSKIRETSATLLLALMGIVWISDSAAFFVGRRWGAHKLAVRISPGKTWEGAIGGLFAVLCYAIISNALIPRLPLPSLGFVRLEIVGTVSVWMALAVLGILGDLTESWAKRIAGVKDSGSILPEHGGMLDRVDALLPVLPIAALVYSL